MIEYTCIQKVHHFTSGTISHSNVKRKKKTVKKLTLKSNKYSIFISEADDGSQQYEIKMYTIYIC